MDSIKIFDYSKKQHRVASINTMPKHDTFMLKTFVVFLLIIAWLCAGSLKTNIYATDLYIPEGYEIKQHIPETLETTGTNVSGKNLNLLEAKCEPQIIVGAEGVERKGRN